MSASHIALLPDRGVVSVSGEDACTFLDNLVTNDLGELDRHRAIHAGLLTPQGKILFEFFIVRHADGLLLDTALGPVPDLLKRLTLYRLRAKVALDDLSSSHVVAAAWGGPPPDEPLAAIFPDPRAPGLGHRLILPQETAGKLAANDEGREAYDRLRIALGVPEPGRDYAPGDTFPHEANFDRFAGVSFTKGCFVGQEVVARMQHKTVVRKRIVRVTGASSLPEGVVITIPATGAEIGRIGSVDGDRALAMLRLDRALEARIKGQQLVAAGVAIEVDPDTLGAYEAAAKARALSGP